VKVVYIVTAKYEYIGKPSKDEPHPYGDNWIRLNDACLIQSVNLQNGKTDVQLKKINAGQLYHSSIDINLNGAIIYTLDQKGGLYQGYLKLTSNLVLPDGVPMTISKN
jgi:hypothetical protein